MPDLLDRLGATLLDATLAALAISGLVVLAIIQGRQPARRRGWAQGRPALDPGAAPAGGGQLRPSDRPPRSAPLAPADGPRRPVLESRTRRSGSPRHRRSTDPPPKGCRPGEGGRSASPPGGPMGADSGSRGRAGLPGGALDRDGSDRAGLGRGGLAGPTGRTPIGSGAWRNSGRCRSKGVRGGRGLGISGSARPGQSWSAGSARRS